MQMTDRQRTAVALSAVGVGALLMARIWRRREAYELKGKSVVITGDRAGSVSFWRASSPKKAQG